MYRRKPLNFVVGPSPTPNNLISEVLIPKNRVHQQLQIVTRRRIAMKIDATSRLQHPVQLRHSLRHHRQIGHHIVLTQERAHRLK